MLLFTSAFFIERESVSALFEVEAVGEVRLKIEGEVVERFEQSDEEGTMCGSANERWLVVELACDRRPCHQRENARQKFVTAKALLTCQKIN